MKIVLKLYATLRDYLPAEAAKTSALTLDVAAGSTVQQIVERCALPQSLCHLVLIDGNFVPPPARASRALQEGETLAIWPPVAGG